MFRTVADLKRYLSNTSTTPESLASQIDISNMTIRRLLKRPATTRLPLKYSVLLNHFANGATKEVAPPPTLGTGGFEKFLADLERDGGTVEDFGDLQDKTKTKLKERGVGSALRDGVRGLLSAIGNQTTSASHRAVCVGALAYFVNPFDLIPDALPGVGYIDDFGVISLALAMVARSASIALEKK